MAESQTKETSQASNEVSSKEIKEYIAIGTVLFICLGFLYLLVYTMRRGSPFPIDASTTLYFVTTFLAILFSLLLLFFTIMPGMARGIYKDTGYENIYHSKENILSIKNMGHFMVMTGLSQWAMMALLYVPIIFEIDDFDMSLSMLGVCILLVLGTMYATWKSTYNKIETAFAVFYINAVCFVWYTFVIFIVMKIVPSEFFDSIFYYAFPLFGVFLTFICYLLVFPKNYEIPAPTKNQRKHFVFALIMLPIIFYPLGESLTALALKTTRLGGDFEATITFYKKGFPYISKEILSEKEPQTSKRLYVILDVGNRVYVSLEENKPKRNVIAIDSKMISSINYM